MKLGMYIKEAWYDLRKSRVYSAVYIIGTGFSLALVMAYLTVQSMHFDNSYPEVHRDLMLIIPALEESKDGGGSTSAMLSLNFIDRFLLQDPIEGVQAVSAITYEDVTVANDRGEALGTVAGVVDEAFWTVFRMDFVDGHALTELSLNQAAPEAVVCESLARLLYGRSDIAGERLFFKDREFRVCGVVRDVPQTASIAFAQLWIPDLDKEARAASSFEWLGRESMLGDYFAVLLAEDRSDFASIRQTIEDRLEIYNSSADVEYKLSCYKGIPTVRENSFIWSGLTSASFTWIGIGVMLFILLIPMINLSGMVSSRMEARMGEFGVRKSFGAWRGDVLQQITGENLLLTLLGGVLGLLLSYVLLGVFSEQFNGMLPTEVLGMVFSMEEIDAAVFSVRDFFKLRLYLLLLAIVLVLNLVSALLPAMKVMRRPITESLNSVK